MMQAVVFHEHGGPEKLLVEERPLPTVGAEQVLIRVKACALNHLDIWIRQGIPAYKVPLPHISGLDVSGVVAGLGRLVKGFNEGDSVFASPALPCFRCPACRGGRDNLCEKIMLLGAGCDGGYAEYTAVDAQHVLKIPKGLTFEQAAAFPLVGMTAWHMLVTRAGLKKGQRVLVLGAGSGIGSMAVQIGRLRGAQVIATVGSAKKFPKAKALGAHHVLDHSSDFLPELVKLTDGRGVDIVFEHVGPATWNTSLRALAKGGTLVTCGATTGREAPFDLRYLFSRELNVLGSYVGTRKDLLEVTKLMAAKKIKPVIDRVYPLAQARAAQEQMLSRNFFGKILLKI